MKINILVLFSIFCLLTNKPAGAINNKEIPERNFATNSPNDGTVKDIGDPATTTSSFANKNIYATSAIPCSISLSITSTSFYCSSSYEGSATVNVSGGTPPYTYEWYPGGQTTPAISNLVAGTYTVLVTDSTGCTAIDSTIISAATLTASATPSIVIAGDSTLLSASYGTSANYSWTPIATITSPNVQNTYAHPATSSTYEVTANAGCGNVLKFVPVTVTGCTFNDSVVKVSYFCPSQPGSITIFPYDGTPPYTYSWSPGGQTTAGISGLPAGGYSVTVTDAAGCNLTNAISLPSSTISYSISGLPPYIAAGDSALLTATCNAPATFSWSPVASVTSPSSSRTYAHPSGNTVYTVTINTACDTIIDSVLISINCLALNMSSTDSYNCASSYDGSARVTITGGIPPFTYLWFPGGATTSSISNLVAGTYSVTVKDHTGCGAIGTTIVNVISPVIITTATPSILAAGDSTYLTATCSNLSIYSWSPAAYVTNPNSQYTYAHPPVTTIFTVTATTDTCGYVVVAYDTITVTGCTFDDSLKTTPYFCPALEGSISINPYGGTAPYTYSWSPGGQTSASITGLTAGNYDVTITDAAGCNLTRAISISSATISFAVSGNPTSILEGDSTLLTATCNEPATFSWTPAATVRNPSSGRTYALPTVTTEYTVSVNTPCGSFVDSVLIQVSCFNYTISSTSSYCSTASITPSGGVAPYTYRWAPGGGTTATITGLSAGIYSITVYDSLGCSIATTVNVVTIPVTNTVSGNPAYITVGDSALLSATCSSPASYSWFPTLSVTHPDSSTTFAHPASTTDYIVTITTPCATYTENVLITVNCFNLASTTLPSYCSSFDGSATITASGGISPYSYSWMPGGQTSSTITGISSGSYYVIVTDNSGCSSTVPVTISEAVGPPPITCSSNPDSIMPGDSSYLTAYCGVAATYVWSPTTGLTDPNSSATYAHPAVTTIYTINALTVCGTAVSYDTVVVYACNNSYNEPICIVTVDTLSGNCNVIWGRTNSPPADGYGFFEVYKDSTAGFAVTHTQALDVLSEYLDPLSYPSTGPVSYKLATVDSCGASVLSPVHTTIYLTVNAGTNVFILNWTAYAGFTPSKYRIFRGPNIGNLVQIDSVPSTQLTYHDTLPPGGSIYLVEAVNPSGVCVPTSHRPGNPLSSMLSGSLSNSYNTTPLGINPTSETQLNLSLYPNPNNGFFTLKYTSPESGYVQLYIYNELGQTVFLKRELITRGKNSEQFNFEALASGIYTLKLETTNSITVRKLILIKN